MSSVQLDNFEKLYKLDLSNKLEKKPADGGNTQLTYLSWAHAWAVFVKSYPAANYKIVKNPSNEMPYFESDAGAIVYTKVWANDLCHEMWLPVTNNANKAMKSQPYEYQVYNKFEKKFITKKVEAYTLFDINKTIMRCLVKNLAMFGLGLYVYAGEDLPEEYIPHAQETPSLPVTLEDIKKLYEIKLEEVAIDYKDKLKGILYEGVPGDINKIYNYLRSL